MTERLQWKTTEQMFNYEYSSGQLQYKEAFKLSIYDEQQIIYKTADTVNYVNT